MTADRPEPQVLFVDDEEHLRLAAGQTLELADITVVTFPDPAAALARVSRSFPGILVTDIRMPDMDGLTLMARALEVDPDLPVILVTGHGDVDLAVQSMRDGAYDFIEKPYAPDRLVDTVRRALGKRALVQENRALRRQVTGRDKVEARVTGRSPLIVRLREQIRAVAATEADVLIVGDTGTGKEVAARALHQASPRAARPFVHVNCAALPADLIESELFGHEAGSFPGATRARFGKFEHGRGGTVFLDEIDSLPLSLQGKLLQAIQTRSITRLGSNDAVPLDVRFIAASKRALEAAAQSGEFRADLLYRLNVVTLHMPPLADRREDVPRLFVELVAQAAARYSRPSPDVPSAVLARLSAKDWPGNIRELRNAADRFVLGLADETPATVTVGRLADQMAAHEKSLISAALVANSGSINATYAALGLSRKALYEKMQKHGLDRASFRED